MFLSPQKTSNLEIKRRGIYHSRVLDAIGICYESMLEGYTHRSEKLQQERLL